MKIAQQYEKRRAAEIARRNNEVAAKKDRKTLGFGAWLAMAAAMGVRK
jgi:hypothetical protein